MKKYYVYTVKTNNPSERLHAFVEHPDLFANEEFDPLTMEFSGVLVEAKNLQEAQRIYSHPKVDDTLISCDEPKETLEFRKHYVGSLKELQKSAQNLTQLLEDMTFVLLVRNIAIQLVTVSDKIAEVSDIIASKTKNHSPEELYRQIIKTYAKEFEELPYRPPSDG